ncbi:MAG: hypothetical protein M3161_05495 [Actinomycetota bacterium]|nr:hypothetical protein [Actinomycetota bacterium]
MNPEATRRLWVLVETYHGLIYFAPEKVDAFNAAGLKGGWMGYFASRAAALGPVPPEVVTALFYNFHPRLVARAIPDAWKFSSPERVLKARYDAARAALDRLVPRERDDDVAVALEVIRAALADLDCSGRALAAAHAALPWPDEPRVALWHGCTIWREYRGDGHVAALTTAGLGPIDAHLTLAASGATSEEMLRVNRGWSEDEWAAARAALVDRGILTGDGSLTAEGSALRERVERLTDELSSPPWERVGAEATARFATAMARIVRSIVGGGALPSPNPMGLSGEELTAALDAPFVSA